MAKDDIVRNVFTLGDAARTVAEQHALKVEALVEHYPSRYDRYSDIESSVPRRIFAYQFFNRSGGNCGYYLPELHSAHLFATPRRWGLPKSHWEPIGHYVRSSDASSGHV